jgi:hypothetical protein
MDENAAVPPATWSNDLPRGIRLPDSKAPLRRTDGGDGK